MFHAIKPVAPLPADPWNPDGSPLVVSMVPDPVSSHALREKLEALPGVRKAVMDGENAELWLACEPDADVAALERDGRRVLEEHGIPGEEINLLLVHAAPVDRRQRVRFLSVESAAAPAGQVTVRVSLELRGDVVTGESTGHAGGMIEIRTAAFATLNALERLGTTDTKFDLVGAKQLRAFDEPLMIVAVSADRKRQLVGAVRMGEDPLRAATLAVLDALNRVLGNFIETPEQR